MKKLNEVFKEYETFDLSKVVGGGDGGPVDPDKTPKPKPPKTLNLTLNSPDVLAVAV